MATSGVYAYSMDRNQIIFEALSLISVCGAFRNPSAEEYSTGARWLNLLIKAWQKKGLRPTQQTQVVIFLNTTSSEYTLGPSGDHAAYTYNQTQTTADVPSGFVVPVASTSGVANGYNIGIELADGSMLWSTVTGFVADTSINIADSLGVDQTINSGAVAFIYPTKIQKPLRFNNCQRALPDGTEAIVSIENRKDYFDISNKTIQGYVTQVHYSPKINDGLLYIFPRSAQVTQVLKATVEYPLEVFTESTQTPPFPDEWVAALIYGLATLIAPIFGFLGPEYESIKTMAAQLEEDIIATDVEDNFIQFTPDINDNFSY